MIIRTLVRVLLHRQRQDFEERDRSALDLIRPFVIRAHHYARAKELAATRRAAWPAAERTQALGLTPRGADVLGQAAQGRYDTNRTAAVNRALDPADPHPP